jgi:hypothetical protein
VSAAKKKPRTDDIEVSVNGSPWAPYDAVMANIETIGSENWLRERFPEKDWHRHPRMDGRTDLCDGTPSDCSSKVRLS